MITYFFNKAMIFPKCAHLVRLKINTSSNRGVLFFQDRLWRKTRSIHPFSNCVGADPNRNWNFHWAGKKCSMQILLYRLKHV